MRVSVVSSRNSGNDLYLQQVCQVSPPPSPQYTTILGTRASCDRSEPHSCLKLTRRGVESYIFQVT